MILDGKTAAAEINSETARRAAALPRPPHLRAVLAGTDAGSEVYVRNKGKKAAELGISFQLDRFPETVGQEELAAHVRALAADPSVDAILVQLPLPRGIDAAAVAREIPAGKDADGFHPENFGRALMGLEGGVPPCTPAGVMALLRRYGAEFPGKEAVVVGRSNIVGKPLSVLLGNAGATVATCHSKTADLALHTRRADILVSAAGRAGLVTADMVKHGAFVVDVGTNRLPDGRVVGDCDTAEIANVAHISPVPGGVGPMTIAMLFANVVSLAERTAK